VVFSDAEYLEKRAEIQRYKKFLSQFITGQLVIAFYDKVSLLLGKGDEENVLVPRVSSPPKTRTS